MYTYIYTHTCIYGHIYIWAYVYVYIYIYIHVFGLGEARRAGDAVPDQAGVAG